MRKLLLVVVVATFVVQCSQQNKHELLNDISQLEEKLRSEVELDSSEVSRLQNMYKTYVEAFPQDSVSPYLMLKAGNLFQGAFNNNSEALRVYDQIMNDYQDHEIVPHAMFMRAYVYDENIKDKDLAVEQYRALISAFPNHPLSLDATNLLHLLQDTLSTEEQVANWIENALQDSINKTQLKE